MGVFLGQVHSEPVLLPPRIVIHGKGGVGKTTFGADAPSPIVMPLEDGTGILTVTSLPKPEVFADVIAMLHELVNEEHEYKSLVIDTVDHLEPLIWDQVCQNDGKGKKHVEEFGYGKGYSMADPMWVHFFRGLDACRRNGMTVIALCHNEERNVDDPQVGSYTRTQPKLHKRANALLYEWADIVGCLDIERMARDIGEQNKRTTRTTATTGQRILSLEDSGGFLAKNRYDLPPQIMIPKEHPYQPLRAAVREAFGIATNSEEAA